MPRTARASVEEICYQESGELEASDAISHGAVGMRSGIFQRSGIEEPSLSPLRLCGDVAFKFSEFLLESISSRLHRLLLPYTRGEERVDELLVGDSSFRGAVLFSSKVCRADVDADGHLAFLPESRYECFSCPFGQS
ncbi:MAG: hypothetical protein OEU68_06920 [Nitrospira sp.]|nr:hypothetical protein [Nitrospira sp.]MDH4243247.1 hypothetical protein [Nitrospira sp.]MDH4356005.1 hypothetical protein [Nitrospira sp.]MDH5317408.1 hypothetical protein [Nitrospira sp.]